VERTDFEARSEGPDNILQVAGGLRNFWLRNPDPGFAIS